MKLSSVKSELTQKEDQKSGLLSDLLNCYPVMPNNTLKEHVNIRVADKYLDLWTKTGELCPLFLKCHF